MHRDLIVVGASAGGVEALQALARDMPPDLPAAVLVVLHMGANYDGQLAPILDRSGPLPAEEAQDGEVLRPATIRVAAPDHHLIVTDGRVQLSRGPRENFHRPGIDALFRSAAVARGNRTIGLLMSGIRDDGVDGLLEIDRPGRRDDRPGPGRRPVRRAAQNRSVNRGRRPHSHRGRCRPAALHADP